ncbi:MAG TPA: hypothetical protein DHN33_08305 [Eubacteriaceae bacterium]|nr:hypothetical protein [Eubacteriaceae bacterium]
MQKEYLPVKTQLGILKTENTQVSVTLKSLPQRTLGWFYQSGNVIGLVAGSLLLIFLILYVMGRLLYAKNVRPKQAIRGRLWVGQSKEDMEEISLNKWKKPKVVIGIGGNQEEGVDITLKDSDYNYEFIMENTLKKSKFSAMDGYRSLNEEAVPQMRARTTGSGIFIQGDQISTVVELNKSTDFQSAEYFFRFEPFEGNNNRIEGENLLKGKW